VAIIDQSMSNQAPASGEPPEAAVVPRLPWWLAFTQLVALSVHLPLLVIAGGGRALARPQTVLLIGVSVSIVSIAAFRLVSRATKSRWTALAIVSVLIVFFWHWKGNDADGISTTSPLTTLLLLTVTVAAAARFATHRLFRLAVLTASIALSGTAALMIGWDVVSSPDTSLRIPSALPPISLADKPDIVFLMIDGYARNDVLEADYSFDNSAFREELSEAGFSIPSRSSANYNGTHFSIPSMLAMDYLTETGAAIHNSDLLVAAAITGGDNRLVQALKDHGYTYVHGGTGNWNNNCGPQVDVCLPNPVIDATAWAILNRTPLAPLLFSEIGHPFTAVNLLRIPTLSNWEMVRAEWSTGPVFAFIHLVLPHAPMFLDEDCRLRVDPALGGHVIAVDGLTAEDLAERRQAYVEQVKCANRTVESFLGQLNERTVVVLSSDHGPDARGPLTGSSSDWDELRIRERYSTFTALRLPSDCPGKVPDDHDLVNSFRLVLNCLDPTLALPLLEPRYAAAGFKGWVVEVEDPDRGLK